jgi:hypothetical protein
MASQIHFPTVKNDHLNLAELFNRIIRAMELNIVARNAGFSRQRLPNEFGVPKSAGIENPPAMRQIHFPFRHQSG